MTASAQRYTAVAIVLHWAIAIAIAGLIALGWWMGDALEDRDVQAQAIAAYQLHKSLGLTVLALSLMRLAWRFMHPPPPLPTGMKPWERSLATAVHWAFYVVIVIMPLTGWLFVSTAWSPNDDRPLDVPTLYFGLFQVPHLFGLAHLGEPVRAALAEALEFTHSKLAWAVIGLTALHVGAALKHQFIDRDNLLARMIPGPPGAGKAFEPARTAALAVGMLAIAIAVGAALWSFMHPPAAAPTEQAAIVHDQADDADDDEVAPRPLEDADQGVAVPPVGAVPAWRVDSAASSIVFAGVHAGIPFEGRFATWRANIRFDPERLDQSSAVVTVQTASASDGVPLHDESLPREEWFDAANHPTATFRTSSFRARGGGAYEARGVLEIKGRAIDLDLPFTLRIDGDRATMEGSTELRRDETDLGMASDPEYEFVSREIEVRVRVVATRAR